MNGNWILQVEGMSDQQIRNVRDAIYWVHQLKGQKDYRSQCIISKIEDLDVIQWWTYLNSHYTGNTKLPSPHYYRATYITLNVRPFGAMKPWSNDEGYSSSYDLTIGRTFKRKDCCLMTIIYCAKLSKEYVITMPKTTLHLIMEIRK